MSYLVYHMEINHLDGKCSTFKHVMSLSEIKHYVRSCKVNGYTKDARDACVGMVFGRFDLFTTRYITVRAVL